MNNIDLHVHSTASDGTVSPKGLVELAKELGLSAIALTDHDSCSGCGEAMERGNELGVEVIPGIEISTKYGVAVHVLGYYIDTDCAGIKEALDFVLNERDSRNRKMAELMKADGLKIDYDDMKRRYGDIIGRPHFAEIMVEQGWASSIKEAFSKYVNKGMKYWLPSRFLTIEQSVEIIREAGGIPVIAHPFQYKKTDEELRELITHCKDHGLLGLECRYSGYTEEQEDYLEALADEYDLFKTGGSDFHGSVKPGIMLGSGTGRLCVPYEFLTELKTLKNSL